MKPLAIVAALIAGAAGAALWAAVSYYANMEVGYIAWGIGLMVGLAAHQLGGEGAATGIVCALIAVGSMLTGKALSYHFSVEQYFQEEVLAGAYNEEQADASQFQSIDASDDAALGQFMIDRSYSEVGSSAEIPEEDLNDFRENVAGRLTEFANESPSLEEWAKSDQAEMIHQFFAASLPPVWTGVWESLGILDAVFGFLGVSTAFRIAMADHEE